MSIGHVTAHDPSLPTHLLLFVLRWTGNITQPISKSNLPETMSFLQILRFMALFYTIKSAHMFLLLFLFFAHLRFILDVVYPIQQFVINKLQ